MIAALPLLALIALAWVLGVFVFVALVIGGVALYRRLVLDPRQRAHDKAVAASAIDGREAGERDAFAGVVEDVVERELVRFPAMAPRWRAKRDVELDAEADELVADGHARLEAHANGEHRR